ncbi:sensor histidine kinase [Anaeromicrobium sediminis]|uniref:histidine kinase n=1 Tax=Anaeromicrobium sediminis TaxID=1478221 RepID=A0A267MM25_9FIRM|nr:HAMP domain-containing sensor histidine kinase [Anaeromicrobium sediminis]PAB59958.1 hypothetical protein CCE28_08365 [Anaeromicrobium sediminis]
MGNTVFKKLLYFYFVIILLSFLILGIAFSQLFSSYYFNRQEKVLLNEGKKINYLVIDYLNNDITNERLKLELQAVEKFLNTRIWIINKQGIIYGVSGDDEEWIGKQITATEMLQVLEGKIITKKGMYHENETVPLLTVGMPIYINGEVSNAIIMHTPLYEVTNVIGEVHKMVIISMSITFVGAFILLWIVSKKISYPLKRLVIGAEKISYGDFSYRIEIEEEGEVGKVIDTFNKMTEKLGEIEKNRKSFISAVAHELRSPLTLIKGFAQGMVDGTIEERDHPKYLDIILRETRRLNALITNLLDIQRMESGKYPINKSEFNMNELISRTLIRYEEEIEKNNIEVQLDLEDNIYVCADKDSIQQVLINLVDNAIKFMKEDPVLTIKTKKKGNKCKVIIRDNGIGISKENIQNIWEEFYKEDKSRNRNKKGTGLGLHIVKKIIDIHNEKIEIKSEVGVGTYFVFYLQLHKNN